MRPEEISFRDDALQKIIRDYTRESGVRNLERKIGAVARKVGTRIAEGKGDKFNITPDQIEEFLDHPIYFGSEELNERTSVPGIVPGLAYTPFGGDILFIEATRMPGGHGFQVTGSVGNVMQELARAALSYVRSRAGAMNLSNEFFEKNDIHMHIPAGATPKDGPSAGVTMATALVSLISGRKVKPHLGMTGEITLRGQVLPIGGVKEKVLAAHRNGLQTVIMPKRNKFDLDDVPDEIKKSMEFIFVETVDDVLNAALESTPNSVHKKEMKKLPKKGKANGKAKSLVSRR